MDKTLDTPSTLNIPTNQSLDISLHFHFIIWISNDSGITDKTEYGLFC